jgi:hypothetical protein
MLKTKHGHTFAFCVDDVAINYANSDYVRDGKCKFIHVLIIMKAYPLLTSLLEADTAVN